jgi:predicted amidophosphoribosyltransferase
MEWYKICPDCGLKIPNKACLCPYCATNTNKNLKYV